MTTPSDDDDAVQDYRFDPTNPVAHLRMVERFFGQNPPFPGSVDIACLGDHAARHDAAALVTLLLGSCREEKGSPLYPRVYVLLPMTPDPAEEIRLLCLKTLACVLPNAEPAKIAHGFDQRIRYLHTECLHHEAILEVFTKVEDGAAMVVFEAGRYRAAHPIDEPNAFCWVEAPCVSSLRVSNKEDFWVPHIVELARMLERPAAAKEVYTLLLAGRPGPILPANVERLQTIRGAVFSGRLRNDLEAILVRELPGWIGRIARGEQVGVGREIESISDDPRKRASLEATVLFCAGHAIQGFERIRPFLDQVLTSQDPVMLANVAWMALSAGAYEDAQMLLSAALNLPAMDEAALEMTHQLAVSMRAETQAAEAHRLLQEFYPRRPRRIKSDVNSSLRQGHYALVVRMIESLGGGGLDGELASILAVARALSSETLPSYPKIVADVTARFPAEAERVVLLCAEHALRGGKLNAAVDLLSSRTWGIGAREKAVDLAVAVLLQWAIAACPPVPGAEFDRADPGEERAFAVAIGAIDIVIEYLADHPEDNRRRIELSNALSFERLGHRGVALLTYLLVNQETETEPDSPEPNRAEPVSPEAFSRFTGRYFDSRTELANLFVLIPEPLPPELGEAPLEALFSTAASTLDELCIRFGGDPIERKTMYMLMKVAMDLSHHLGLQVEPFEILRSVASALASRNDFQGARDLAGHALGLLGDRRNPRQRRAAWLTFADTYQRCRNLPEAILGWLCGCRAAAKSHSPLWLAQDIQLKVRLLRDVGLYAEAIWLLDHSERALVAALRPHRVMYLRATLLLQEAAQQTPGGPQTVSTPALIEAAVQALELAIAERDDVLPAALMAGQVLIFGAVHGHPAPATLAELFERACTLVPTATAEWLRAFTAPKPSREQLLAVLRGMGSARYATDLATDLLQAVGIARRALAGFLLAADASGALLAVEVMAVQSVCLPEDTIDPGTEKRNRVIEEVRNWTVQRALTTTEPSETTSLARSITGLSGAVPDRESTTLTGLLDDPELPASFAKALSQKGLDVHALAIGVRNRLVRISIRKGEVIQLVEESPDVFNVERLRSWRLDHPIAYGNPDRQGLSYLMNSMDGIGTSGNNAERRTSLYVLSHDLADMPANLLLTSGEPAGRLGSVATVPSLSWLQAARLHPRRASGRRIAWLLPVGDRPISPLRILRDELEGPLAEKGFTVTTAAKTRVDLRNCDIALIGGHGSVWIDNGSFRAVSDELRGRLSTSELASRLAGSGVVVLLVCSGGRLAREGFSLRASGMPYELLRRGCRAVVASPWPVDVLTARRWALSFVEAYLAGGTVADATFLANETVRKRSPDRCEFLAMHVIGDPSVVANLEGNESAVLR